MKELQRRTGLIKNNLLLIFISLITCSWMLVDTITFCSISTIVNNVKRKSSREIARQLAVYKSIGGSVETFDVNKNYIYDMSRVTLINDETNKLIESIKLQGHKATPEQKEMLIRIINDLDNIIN